MTWKHTREQKRRLRARAAELNRQLIERQDDLDTAHEQLRVLRKQQAEAKLDEAIDRGLREQLREKKAAIEKQVAELRAELQAGERQAELRSKEILAEMGHTSPEL